MTLTNIERIPTHFLDCSHLLRESKKVISGTPIYYFAQIEKVVNYTAVVGPKSIAEAKKWVEESGWGFGEHYECKDSGWIYHSYEEREFDGYGPVRLEARAKFSKCGFFGMSMNPPVPTTDAEKQGQRYLPGSTGFQMKEGLTTRDRGSFGMNKDKSPYILFDTCDRLVDGKEQNVCKNCVRKLQTGWRMLKTKEVDA